MGSMGIIQGSKGLLERCWVYRIGFGSKGLPVRMI